MDLFAHMTTFVRIADAGSITKAARSLRLSVPMASRHLRALEEDVGTPLMRRTTRQLDLTEAGVELLSRARTILAELAEAREVVRPGRGIAGKLVLSMPASFALDEVAPLFPALLEKHPRLRLDLRFEDRRVDLLADGVDIAIRAGSPPPDSPYVVARPLATIDRLLCASPSFRNKHRITRIDSLATVPCIIQGRGPAQWSFDTASGPIEVRVDGPVHTNSVLAIREAAVAGAGAARLPVWICHAALRKKQLVPLLKEATLPSVDVYGLFHVGSRGSIAIRTVLDYLADALPRHTKMRRLAAG